MERIKLPRFSRNNRRWRYLGCRRYVFGDIRTLHRYRLADYRCRVDQFRGRVSQQDTLGTRLKIPVARIVEVAACGRIHEHFFVRFGAGRVLHQARHKGRSPHISMHNISELDRNPQFGGKTVYTFTPSKSSRNMALNFFGCRDSIRARGRENGWLLRDSPTWKFTAKHRPHWQKTLTSRKSWRGQWSSEN